MSPASVTTRGPERSIHQPVSGDNANIPRVWTDSITPSTPRPSWCRCAWTGTAVITETITNWPTTMTPAASSTGRPLLAVGTRGASAGLERRMYVDATRAEKTAARASRNGPAIAGRPATDAADWDGARRNEPPAAPKVL